MLTLYSSALAGQWGAFMLDAEKAGVVAAPPSLEGTVDAYAVHIVGDSMEPRYRAGEIVFVHPWKPVRKDDYVVVQIAQDGHVMGMIKRFVSQSETELVLEQLNPSQTIRLEATTIKSVHRIVASSEG